MFINQLSQCIANKKFSFQVEEKAGQIFFTVIPQHTVPECEGEIAQAHAALAVPLRLVINNDDATDENILTEINRYMSSRTSLQSNLAVITNATATATRAVKQSSKDDDSKKGNKAKASTDNQPQATTSEQPAKSNKLEL